MKAVIFGLRNLQRNYRRSLVTAMSIAFGFAAASLFAGYTQIVYRGLTDQAIYGELLGHFTISKKGLAMEGRLHPEQYLFNREEIEKVSAVVHANLPDMYIAPRLHLKGMLSNGRASTIFIAEGIAPHDMRILRGPRDGVSGGLEEDNPTAVTVAVGLAEMLRLKEGSYAALMLSTMHSQTNALDVVISDMFSTGNAGTNDKFMYLPLKLAQTLYDAENQADRLTLLAQGSVPTDADRLILAAALKDAGFDVEINTWQELSAFYRQVKSMFDMIFGFLLAIVLAIVVMSITNAMSMSVVERTKEIGTLRAIGMKRIGVIRLFVTEALLLVLVGCVLGTVITIAVRMGVNAADLSYLPPNATDRVPLLIGMDTSRTVMTAILLSVLSVVSAWFPAKRAAQQPVIDSLAHV
jgi:putative ABC transport system permease protein